MKRNVAEECFTGILPAELSYEDMQKIETLLVPVPRLEVERIGTLRSVQLLETPAESSYDRYTNLCARVFKTPICLISLVDVDRQWFKSRVGLEVSQTHRNIAFCAYTVHECSNDVVIVHYATKDPRFCDNPLVTGFPHIRFYAGAALIVQGQKIGSLCIIDTKPRPDFNAADAVCLREIATIVEQLIEERRQRFMQTESDLARMTVSILYNLRSPLKALQGRATELQNDLEYSFHRMETVEGDNIVARLNDFQLLVHRLEVAIQANLQLALAFTDPHSSWSDSFHINSYIHLLLYAQEQSAMPLKENFANYSEQLQKMRNQFATHTLRMVELVGKLQCSVSAFDSSLCDSIVWNFPSVFNRSDKEVPIYSLHTAYLLNFHVLDLVLNCALITNALQHPKYSVTVTCSVAKRDEHVSSHSNEEVCQFVLAASFIISRDFGGAVERYHDILSHIVKTAEGTFSYQVNRRDGDDSNETELVYTVSLPCIAFTSSYHDDYVSSDDRRTVLTRHLSSDSTSTTVLYHDDVLGECSLPGGNCRNTEDFIRPCEYTSEVVKAVAGKCWRSVFKSAQRRVVPK
eukprot:gene26704-32269_t